MKKPSLSSVASDFGTVDYFRKSNTKTAVVLHVLKRGYTVLMVDPDVVLFRNPFPYFNCTLCDVHFQMDRDMHNRYLKQCHFLYILPHVQIHQVSHHL